MDRLSTFQVNGQQQGGNIKNLILHSAKIMKYQRNQSKRKLELLENSLKPNFMRLAMGHLLEVVL